MAMKWQGPRRLLGDRSGNVAMIFAAAAIPALGLVGAAVDYSRATGYRTALQSAADAGVVQALLAGKTKNERETLAGDVAHEVLRKALPPGDVKNVKADYKDIKDGGRVTVTAKVKTLIAGVIQGGDQDEPGWMSIAVTAEAKTGGGGGKVLEIALVLDNTGSMRNDMKSLQGAARDLVTAVMPATGDSVKMAVVPYVGAVNPGATQLSMDWMDVKGDSRWHATRLRDQRTLKLVGCTPSGWGAGPWGSSSGGGPSTGGNDRSGALDGVPGRILRELFGVAAAHAQQAAPPPGWRTDGCFLNTPAKVSHFDLFKAIPNVAWKGCVEARPEPYDVLDAAPSSQTPDTLFVPYFWPDEPDVGANKFVYPNNYMKDPSTLPAGYAYDGEGTQDNARGTYLLKYDGKTKASIEEKPPFTRGPNAACPDEVLPLTPNQGHVLGKIAKLSHWEGSGTLSSEGLMWGWRALSPEPPFVEGLPYGSAEKHLVIFTDGINGAAEQEYWGFGASDYTAYGTLREDNVLGRNRRLRLPNGSMTYQRYKSYLDGRMAEACANIKAAGITIHAVTFKVNDTATEDLFKSCVSDAKLYYYTAGNEADLRKAFDQISKRLKPTTVYLSR